MNFVITCGTTVGCVSSEFDILLKHDENTLDLSTIIGEGELVYINYSWAGHPHYILTQEPLVRINKNKIMLFPSIMTENLKEVEIGVYLWFAPKEMLDDLSTMLLLDAFQKYYDRNYRYMLISAQTSVEVLQHKFLNKLLKENKISNERIEDFLENKAPFSTQLFTLLPFLANIMDFPIWKKGSQIEEGLKILRDNRNDVVHRGKLERQLNDDKLQKALLGAFFALKYFKIIHKIS